MKQNARGKKGPVRIVFTGVLSLIREGMTPSQTRIFVHFFANPNPTDFHIETANMSGEDTSNRKINQETTEQCDCHLKEA